ncbi:MAG: phosphopyruvate hydratase [Mycoplasmoidaceae bacterium]
MGLFDKLSNKTIKQVVAYEVLDSRGFPTVACKVTLACGAVGKAMVPSGASTGQKEALELRDGDKKRFNGKGVLKAINNINRVIGPQVIGKNGNKQAELDDFMIKLDGTNGKTKLGANAILAVSLANAKACANANKMPLYMYIRSLVHECKENEEYFLPVPMLNVINGGAHADNTIDFQEFMFMPIGAKTIREAVQIASECFHALGKLLKAKGLNTSKGDEGGYAPLLKSAEEALDIMVEAIKTAGYKPGVNQQVAIALDCAASEMYDEATKKYVFKKALDAKHLSKDKATLSTDQMINYLVDLTKKYPIISIEDGLAENDWEGFAKLTALIGNKVQIVGDDLYCTNPNLTQEGLTKKATNAVLIKLNQIGTLTETINTIQLARHSGWAAVVSHRSGETEDTFIADLSVALNCGQIKTGSMSRSERICKYNRLMEIEDELSLRGVYEGVKTFKNLGGINEIKK